MFSWKSRFQITGRVSSVGIATRYGLDGPKIESRWEGGEIFRTRPDRSWGPPSFLYNVYRVFPGGKVAGARRWPPTPSNAKVKERVELYICSPSGSSWPVLGRTLPLPLPLAKLIPLDVLFKVSILGSLLRIRVDIFSDRSGPTFSTMLHIIQ